MIHLKTQLLATGLFDTVPDLFVQSISLMIIFIPVYVQNNGNNAEFLCQSIRQ